MDGKNIFCFFISNFKKRIKFVHLDQDTSLMTIAKVILTKEI